MVTQKLTHKVMFQILGSVETDVMPFFWEHGRATIGEVHAAIGGPGRTYQTVATTMVRLVEKGILDCDRSVWPHVYRSLYDRDEFARLAAQQLADQILGGNSAQLAALITRA